jgi:hypothetical protein
VEGPLWARESAHGVAAAHFARDMVNVQRYVLFNDKRAGNTRVCGEGNEKVPLKDIRQALVWCSFDPIDGKNLAPH